MPKNCNPRTVELLDWHGHSRGGVHVPFQGRKNPYGSVIETSLINRLRLLGQDLATSTIGTRTPRWIFLVGGPGNGKSETVEDFVGELDRRLGLDGELAAALGRKFSREHLAPRKVEISSDELGSGQGVFGEQIGRLILIQDATGVDTAQGNAAKELACDVAELLTEPDSPPPVFIACANRGLLARAMREAVTEFGHQNEATSILKEVIRASSLGAGAGADEQQSCWPLKLHPRFACWPLDITSLVANDAGQGPVETILLRAIASQDWNVNGRCANCDARQICPFFQNVNWLSGEHTRGSLLKILRRGELSSGQRWNFRDSFSLIAKLIVGDWNGFHGFDHPCDWVHANVADIDHDSTRLGRLVSIVSHLYPHVLFRDGTFADQDLPSLHELVGDDDKYPQTAALLSVLDRAGETGASTAVDEILYENYGRLDPMRESPVAANDPLRRIEDAFCQSVEQGNSTTREILEPARAEQLFLNEIKQAENEWDLLGRDSSAAGNIVGLLRSLACVVCKRSLGVRHGRHGMEVNLAEYESRLRDASKLRFVQDTLRALLGGSELRFDLLNTIGQPSAESGALVTLYGQVPGIRPIPAPIETEHQPGHDVPAIQLAGTDFMIPLTFDFFLALNLLRDGCASSSLPASVRAALDRLRHRYASELSRDEARFVEGIAKVVVGSKDGVVSIPAAGHEPLLRKD